MKNDIMVTIALALKEKAPAVLVPHSSGFPRKCKQSKSKQTQSKSKQKM